MSESDTHPKTAAAAAREGLTGRLASAIAAAIAVLWTIPTAGLFISSFRPEEDVKSSGWWNVFTDPSFTLQNYKDAFNGGTSGGNGLSTNLINSIVITLPAVLIPISLATLAAYQAPTPNQVISSIGLAYRGQQVLSIATDDVRLDPVRAERLVAAYGEVLDAMASGRYDR